MSARRSAATQEVQKVIRDASDLDIRRQAQIRNQIVSINRLLTDGSYDSEMAKLHEQLAETQVRLADIQLQLEAALKGKP